MRGMNPIKFAALAAVTGLLALEAPAGAVASAELYTSAGYRYGRYEARIQFPQPDGVVGSYFLWKNGSEVSGTYWNELDFEKIRAECALQLNAIYGLPQANHSNMATGVSGTCTGYHLYTYEWTPTYISWQVDGVELRRDTGASAQAFADNATNGMQLRINIWPGDTSFGGTFSESSLPVYQFVSWAQYSNYTPGAGDDGGDFTLRWRETFDAGQPSGWLTGTWASPFGHSTHAAANVVFTGGVAVLALTADDATGYSGTPPADDGELPTVHVPTGVAGAAGSAATGAGGNAGGGAGSSGGDDGGCGCATPGDGGASLGATLLLLALVLARRR